MLDLDAHILPGIGLGGLSIGDPVETILAAAEPVRVIVLPVDGEGEDPVTIHSFGAIRTWSVRGVVMQVGAFKGYRGRTAAGIGVGSTIAEIGAAYGDVAAAGAEGMVELSGTPGIGIETTEWANGDRPDPSARAIQLFVHAVEE